MCSYKSVQQVYHMQVWEHLLLHSWRAWHGVPAKRLRSQGVCRTSLFFLTSIHFFDSMVFVLLCGATPLPVWLEAKLKLCFQDSHVWTSSRQRAHLPSGVVGSSICIVNEGAILLFKMPTFADHNNHRTPQIRKQIFTENCGKNISTFGNCGNSWAFFGVLGPWTWKIIPRRFGEKTHPLRIQPTDLQLNCAAFGSGTDVRWLHFQSILRLEDLDTSVQSWLLTSGYAPCVQKKEQNSLNHHVSCAGKFTRGLLKV